MENLYDGEDLVCELDASGNVVAGIVHGANGSLVDGNAGYQFDPQGNAMHLLNDNGYAVAHLAYDAWGELKWGSNPTPYGYKGQWGYYMDTETGLLLLTYRYLDPATGRFLTRDPIGVEGGVNLYAYVGNSPVSLIDQNGLAPYLLVKPVPPKREISCDPTGRPVGISRNDPRYGYAMKACTRYAKLRAEMEKIAWELCGGKDRVSIPNMYRNE